jgi:sulfide:quinone oxidoreductase
MTHVVILGGGFAGVEAAIFARKNGFDTTLISNTKHVYIRPISIWIPTGEITPDKARLALNDLAQRHGFKLVTGAVTKIDSANNLVYLGSSPISYDQLILAMGGATMKPPGVEHTLSICGPPKEALEIKERLDKLIEKGSGKIAFGFGGNPKDPSAVRGGPVFELLFNVEKQLRSLGIRKDFEITFFAPMPEPGKKMGKKALKMLDKMLQKRGVKKRVGKKIIGFHSDAVDFEGKETLESDLIIFTPGGTGHPVVRESSLPMNEAGYVKINDHCLVEGTTNVYATGDIAAIEGPDWRAKQGHLAETMSRVAIAAIAAKIQGSKDNAKIPGYSEHISILCLMDMGDSAALVKRDSKKSSIMPLPLIGHSMKKSWGVYWKKSKLEKIPRLLGR